MVWKTLWKQNELKWVSLYIYTSSFTLVVIFLVAWMTSKAPVVAVRFMLLNKIVGHTDIEMFIFLQIFIDYCSVKELCQ